VLGLLDTVRDFIENLQVLKKLCTWRYFLYISSIFFTNFKDVFGYILGIIQAYIFIFDHQDMMIKQYDQFGHPLFL